MTTNQLILFCLLATMLGSVHAETNYVIDELRVGLHKDGTTESPIVKIVPSGTALEVLGRQGDLVKVREPDGEEGWVHKRYLINTEPDNTRMLELQQRNTALEKKLQQKQAAANTGDSKELERQLDSERLKVGELQAQLADLKARIGASDNGELLEELERLRQANNDLVAQLAMAGVDMPAESSPAEVISASNWKLIAVSLACLFALGVASGAFLLDYLNRRRHGGFRV